MTLQIIEEEGSGTVTAVLSGRLDTASSAQFAVDMLPLMENADRHIVLDCRELAYVASSGLRQLLTLRKHTIVMGGDVTLCNVKPEVKQVFAIAGFSSLFIFD